MADAAAQDDVIEREERTLIHSIIDFGDTVVREVMVPRPDMVAVRVDGPGVGGGRDRHRGRVQPHPGVRRRASTTSSAWSFIKDLMRAEREGKQDQPCLGDHA